MQNGRNYAIALTLIAAAIGLYAPAILTPFWGDDYHFLNQTSLSIANGVPWWRDYFPSWNQSFWRPLSQGTYWRFIVSILRGNPFAAHASNFSLWICSCAVVGSLGFEIGVKSGNTSPTQLGLISSGVFGLSGVHFLPVHWISTANSSFLVVSVGVYVFIWLKATTLPADRKALFLCVINPFVLAMALFSKESAVLAPMLAVCTQYYSTDTRKLDRIQAASLIIAFLVVSTWFLVDFIFSPPKDPGYALHLGLNTIKNLTAQFAWLLNTPREAFRMLVGGQILIATLWIASTVALAGTALFISCNPQRNKLANRWLLIFILISYLPYYFLTSQSYAYYAAISLIPLAITMASGLMHARLSWVAVAALIASSSICIVGSRNAPNPSLIGKALKGESELIKLSSEKIDAPLYVKIRNSNQFYAVGLEGLAWRLRIPSHSVILVNDCPGDAMKILIQQNNGTFEWADCR